MGLEDKICNFMGVSIFTNFGLNSLIKTFIFLNRNTTPLNG